VTREGEFTAKTKVLAWKRASGLCEECRSKPGKEYDHVRTLAEGGDNTLENCRLLCGVCHKAKTGKDVGRIRKADRQFRAHAGIKRTTRPMPGSKRSRWRKRLDGSVEER
jgi:5-methylcytosine-specific restriction enzyme A